MDFDEANDWIRTDIWNSVEGYIDNEIYHNAPLSVRIEVEDSKLNTYRTEESAWDASLWGAVNNYMWEITNGRV